MANSERNVSAPRTSFPANPRGFLFPPIAWAVFFAIIYSVQGAGCASGLAEVSFFGINALRLVLAAIALLTAGSILLVGIWSATLFRRFKLEEKRKNDDRVQQSRFLVEGAAFSAALFFIATLWIGLPIAWSGPCG